MTSLSNDSFSKKSPMVAVLAVQGAFAEHENKLEKLGVRSMQLRSLRDVECPFDAVILPGGESTVQAKLLKDLNMMEPLRRRIKEGLPVLATCAGMILLATHVLQGDGPYLATLPMTVRRNAYGRQLNSFHTEEEVQGIGRVPMTFIRAPYVESIAGDTKVLARVSEKIVAVRHGRQMALAFHPELDESQSIHRAFLKLIPMS